MIPPGIAHSAISTHNLDSNSKNTGSAAAPIYPGMKAAEILQIVAEVQLLKESKDRGRIESLETTTAREKVLRKIMEAMLEVRLACSSIDADLAYTYDAMQRGQRTQDVINNTFTLLNFLQFGILYSLEGRSRIHKQFIQSSVLTGISAGVGTGLPTLDILFNKYYRVKDVAPPKFIDQNQIKIGGPVDGKSLPPLVERFLDSPDTDGTSTRRQSMYRLWETRYGVDASKPGTLCSLIDVKSQSPFELVKRTLLLWSLHTFVEDFDQELLALAKSVRTQPETTATEPSSALSPTARDAASLLNCGAAANELISLNRSGQNSDRRKQLELTILESSICGTLETLVASDKAFEELNYAYDVALSSMLSRRGKWLQRNFDVNFIHNGVAGSVATLLYLKNYTKAGNEVFVVSGGIGTALSALALLQSHGGWRRSETPPNSLADLFALEPQSQYRFSPVIATFLNTPDPLDGKYKSRKEELFSLWKKYRATTMSLNKQKNLEKLASMPNVKWETIKILRNRIYCLDGLKAMVESLNSEILDLLTETQVGGKDSAFVASNPASGAPRDLLDLSGGIARIQSLKNESNTEAMLEEHLKITRKILTAFLDIRVTSSNLDVEIIHEKQVFNRMSRDRDMATAIINNINFFQINILDMIIDGPLGLSSKPNYALYGNRMTIVSGLMAIGLASAAFLAQKGGLRLSPSEPNMLAACFGIEESKANAKYTPLLLKFLNTPQLGKSISRKEQLLYYWKESEVFDMNVGKESARQKLAAYGKKHHFWNETIRLLRNRLCMLTDLRAIVDQMDLGLRAVLKEVDQ